MKFLKPLFFVSAILLFFSLFFHNSFEFKQDLGRHLLLGKIISQTHQVPGVNLFSYTYPNYPFINSHWLSEVVFYQLSKTFSLSSLVIFTTILMTATLFLVLWWTHRRAQSLAASALALAIFSPILLERTEIRPEIFAYFFIAVFVLILGRYLSAFKTPQKSNYAKWLWLLPIFEVLWVNMHILFFLGPILVTLGTLSVLLFTIFKEKFAFKKALYEVRPIFIILLLTALATLVNPEPIRWALYPLGVLNNYGYAIEENQNVFFLENMIFNPNIAYFKFALIVFVLSFLFRQYKFESPMDFFEILCGSLAFLPVIAIRMFPLFFLINLSVFANNLASFNPKLLAAFPAWQKYKRAGSVVIISTVIFLTLLRAGRLISGDYYQLTESEKRFGMKVVESGKKAIDFVQRNNLSGPIFNNFDVGGYLDYRFYPRELVFVDNRPEAYSKSFFEKIYYPMQTNTENFNTADNYFKFNLVIFSHTDRAENFIGDLYRNDKWQLVYLDNYLTVFVKKSTYPNVAKKYAINPESFDYQSDNYLDYVYLARATLLLGWKDQGIKYLQRAYSLNPNSIAVLQALGNLYAQNPTTFALGQSLFSRYQQSSLILF